MLSVVQQKDCVKEETLAVLPREQSWTTITIVLSCSEEPDTR